MRNKPILFTCLLFVSLMYSAAQSDSSPSEENKAIENSPENSTSKGNSTDSADNGATGTKFDESASDVSKTDGAASATSEDSGTSGDKDTSESLADYFLELLKNRKDNATVPTTTTQKVSWSTERTGVDLTTPRLASSTEDNLEDVTDESKFEWSYFTTEQPFSSEGKANCNMEVDMSNYCEFDQIAEEYFHYDLTTFGLAGVIFDMDIVQRLQFLCPKGEWCLGDEVDALSNIASSFYRGPFLRQGMWVCLEDVYEKRKSAGCDDRNFNFLVDAADFLFKLFPSGEPASLNERRCFGHALAALHVSYAQFLANNMTDAGEDLSLCDGEGYRMTKTYLCADDACQRFFDPREEMEVFPRWQWFMDNVNDVIDNCNLDNECGSLGQGDTGETWFGGNTGTSPTAETSTQAPVWSEPTGPYSPPSEEDENMMIALMVATAVGVFFMVMGLIFWRRNRRRSHGYHYYRESGYGKVPNDEVGLLRGNASD